MDTFSIHSTLEKLYCHHNNKTIRLLEKIKDITDMFAKYDMSASLNYLSSELPAELKDLDLKNEIEYLINANYIKETNQGTYNLTEDGMSLLRQYSRFNTLHNWGKLTAIVRKNYSALAVIFSL